MPTRTMDRRVTTTYAPVAIFTRRGLSLLLAIIPTALVVALMAAPATAENNFSFAYRDNQAALFVGGFRGEHAIRTNPATHAGVTYAHPFQVFFSGGTFLAVGTY